MTCRMATTEQEFYMECGFVDVESDNIRYQSDLACLCVCVCV